MRVLMRTIFIFGLFILPTKLLAQITSLDEFVIRRDAERLSRRCFSITPDENSRSGAVWFKDKLDISQPFELNFVIYMGERDGNGADGIAFVLHNDPADTLGDGAFGEAGGGLGFSSHSSQGTDRITPSVAIELDTWRNGSGTPDDPAYDHTAVVYNGDNETNTQNIVDGDGNTVKYTRIKPASLFGTADNVEDNACYEYRIRWDPATNELELYVDGTRVFTHTGDIINTVFSGTTTLRYGFTGSTGGARNEQTICLFGGNTQPFAEDDFAVTEEGTPVKIPVTDNDFDPDGDDLLKTVVTSNPTNGSINVINQDTIEYIPDTGFVGTDQFTYQTCDVNSVKCYAKCDTATVTINVNCDTDLDFVVNERSPNEKCNNSVPDNGIAEVSLNTPPVPALPDLTNAVAHWKFDETTGNTAGDEIANFGNNTGVLRNFGSPWVSGNEGGALNFDGTDDHIAIDNFNYDANTTYAEFSTSLWIRTADGGNQILVSYDESRFWSLGINYNAGPGELFLEVATDAGRIRLEGNSRIDDGQWHHIVALYDNGRAAIYVDGSLNASTNRGSVFGGENRDRFGFIGVGSERGNASSTSKGPDDYFQGQMDEVFIFNNALNDSEINDLYLNGTGNPSLGDYTFNWYHGSAPSATPDFKGVRYENLPEGTYTVEAENKITGCVTEPEQVTINRVTPPAPDAEVWVTDTLRSCAAPDGGLAAGIIDGTDTITTNHTFVWYLSDFIGDTIAVGSNPTGLTADRYVVDITSQVTGCDTTLSIEVPSQVTQPVVHATVTQNIVNCDVPNEGRAEAAVGGSTAGYSFSWYNGNTVNMSTASSGSVLNNASTGFYTVVATNDTTGCESTPVTIEIEDLTEAPDVVTTIVSQQTSCDPAQSSGALDAHALDGSGNPVTSGFEFNWYKGQNNTVPARSGYSGGSSVDQLSAGTYRLVVEDLTNRCITTRDVDIIEDTTPPVLDLDSRKDNTSCDSLSNNGAISVSVGGNTADYNFYWYEGNFASADTTSSLVAYRGASQNSLAAGDYTVFAAEKNLRCISNPVNVTLTDDQNLPDLDLTEINPQRTVSPLPPDGAGRATVNATSYGGGTQDTLNYSFNWYAGAIAPSALGSETPVSGLAAPDNLAGDSDYTVQVVNDTTSCNATGIIYIGLDATKPVLSLLSVQNVRTCTAPYGSRIEVRADTIRTAADGYDFEWTDSSGNILTSTTEVLENQPPGDYTVSVTDPYGRVTDNPLTVTVNPLPSFAINTTVTADQQSCNPANPTGAAAATVNAIALGGGTTDITSYTFNWYKGEFLDESALPASPDRVGDQPVNMSSGKWTVQVISDSTNCSHLSYLTMPDNPIYPVIDATASVTPVQRCAAPLGSEIRVSADGGRTEADGYTFEWRDAGGNLLPENTSVLSNVPAGQYAVRVTNPLGCESSTARSATVNPLSPVASSVQELAAQRSCDPASPNGSALATIDATSRGGGSSDTLGYRFYWFEGTYSTRSAVPALSSANFNTARVDELKATDYTVLTVGDSTGCEQMAYITITEELTYPVLDPLVISNEVTRCAAPWGSVAEATANGGLAEADGYSFTWEDGSGAIVGNNSTLTNVPPGDYTVTVMSPFGCETLNPQTITLNSLPAFTANAAELSPQTSCDPANPNGGGMVTIDDTVLGGSNDTTGYRFEWYAGTYTDTVSLSSLTPVATTARASGLASGNYTLLTSSNSTACITLSTTSISEKPDIPMVDTSYSVTNAQRCEAPYGSEIIVTADGGNTTADGYTFIWEDASGTVLADTGNVLSDAAPGNYRVRAVNPLTCVSEVAQTISIGDDTSLPTLTLQPLDNTGCSLDNGIITAGGLSGNAADYNYYWARGAAGNAEITTGLSSDSTQLNNRNGGLYYLTIEDKTTACVTTEQVRVNDNPAALPVADTLSTIPVTDCNSPNGEVVLELTSGIQNLPPDNSLPRDYTFSLVSIASGSGSTITSTTGKATFNGLDAGDYEFTVTDNFTGCTSRSDTVTITINQQLTFTETFLSLPNSCTVNNGEVRIETSAPANTSTTAGAPGFTYTWYFRGDASIVNPLTASHESPGTLSTGNDFSQERTDLASGYYTIIIENQRTGCVSEETFFLPVTDPPTVAVTGTGITDRCTMGNGSIDIAITPSGSSADLDQYIAKLYAGSTTTGTPVQSWIPANNSDVAHAFTSLDAGDYTVVLEENFGSFCLSNTEHTTVNLDQPPLTISPSQNADYSCNSSGTGQVAVSVTGNDGNTTNFSYEWFAGNSASGTSVAGSAATPANLSAGFYTVEITDTDGPGNGCTYEETVELQKQLKTIAITGEDITPQTACLADGTAAVTEITVDGSVTTLSDYTFELQQLSGNAYTETGDGTTATPYANMPAGNYRIRAMNDTTDCLSGWQTFNVADDTERPQLNTNLLSPDFSCNAATPTGSIEILPVDPVSGDNSNFNFNWYEGTSTSTALPAAKVDGSNPALGIQLKEGQYTVVVTDDDGTNEGCTNQITVSIGQEEKVKAYQKALSNQLACNPDGSIQLTGVEERVGTGTTTLTNLSDYTFTLENSSAGYTDTQSAVNPAWNNLEAGNYVLTGTNALTDCAIPPASFTLTNETTPAKVSFTNQLPDISCDNVNPSGEVEAVAQDQASGDGTNFNFAWDIGGSTRTTPRVTDLPEGIYEVTVTDTDGTNEGCVTKQTVEIRQQNVNVVYNPTVGNQQACIPDGSIQFASLTEDGSAVSNLSDYEFYVQGNGIDDTLSGASPVIHNLEAATYFISGKNTVTGCVLNPMNASLTNETRNPEVAFTLNNPDFSCAGGTPEGVLTAQASDPTSGNTSGFSYNWYKGDTTATALAAANINGSDTRNTLNLEAGAYTVEITDNSGTNEGCRAVFTYQVPKQQKQYTLKPLVTDQKACLPNGAVTVNSVESFYEGTTNTLSATEFSFFLVANNGNDTTALAGNSINGMVAGNYQLFGVRSASDNCVTQTAPVTINDQSQAPEITLLASYPNLSCSEVNATGFLEIMAEDKDDPASNSFSYEWSKGTTTLPDTDVRIENLTDTVYTIRVTDTEGMNEGCEQTKNFTVSRDRYRYEVETDTYPQISCLPSGEVEFDFVKGFYQGNETDIPLEDVAFTLIDNRLDTIIFNPTMGNNTLENLRSGEIFIKGFNTQTGCTITPFVVTIENNRKLPAINIEELSRQYSLSADTSTWTGALLAGATDDSVHYGTSSFTYSYNWYEDENYPGGSILQSGPEAQQLDSGLYVVRVDNETTGCRNAVSYFLDQEIIKPEFTVNTSPQSWCSPNGEIAVSDVILNGEAESLSEYHLNIYHNFPGAPNQTLTSGNTFNGLAEGTYYLTVYNNRLQVESDVVQVNIANTSTPPNVELNQAESQYQNSCDTTIMLNGALAVDAFEFDFTQDDYSYTWYEGRRVDADQRIEGAEEYRIANLASGFYTVSVTNEMTSCETVNTYFVEEDINLPVVTASSQPASVCNPDQADGVAVGNVSNPVSTYTYRWYAGEEARGNPDYEGKTWKERMPGVYTVIATDDRISTCVSDPVQVEVTDEAMPVMVDIMVEQPLTNCDPTLANGQARATASGTGEQFNFTWFNSTNDEIASGPVASSLGAGTFTVQAVDVLSGCVGESEIEISGSYETVLGPADTVLSQLTRCDYPNGVAAVNANTQRSYNYIWYDSNGNVINDEDTDVVVEGLAAGTYTVTATSLSSGCTSEPDTFRIREEILTPNYQVETTASSCTENQGSARIIDLDDDNLQIGINKVIWYDPARDEVISENFEANELYAQPYDVELVASNGCTFEETINIDADINVFNGLSPNGDNLNDFFEIPCIDQFRDNSVKLFNRAGTLIYEANGYDNSGTSFRGRGNRGMYVGGRELPAGTYFYIIKTSDHAEPKTGYLELTR